MRVVALVVSVAVLALVGVAVLDAVRGSVTVTTVPAGRPVPVPGGLATTAVDAGVTPRVAPPAAPAAAAGCAADRAALQAAVDTYLALEGSPPPDEDALVRAGLLREPSALHDVRAGQVVAQDPRCG